MSLGNVPRVRLSPSVLLGLLLALSAVFARGNEPAIVAREIPTPADPARNASGSALATGPDGTVWLTWLETATDQPAAFRVSTFDAAARRWRPPQTIAQHPELHVSGADVPALTVGRNGRATALWHVKNPPSPETAHLHHGAGYHAVTSSTHDGGRTWSAPERVSLESDINEFAALATLADGRVLAVWLDARVKKIMGAHPDHKSGSGGHPGMKLPQQLYSRFVAPAAAVNRDLPDTLVEYSVCDCCHTALTAFPDGTALLVYRGRGEGEVRDIRVTRFRGEKWDEPRTLNNDDWRIAGCPVNGPQLASDGGRVAAAWFTGADNDPRVLASFSPDAGGRFLMPLRLSGARPAGRVSTLMLHDGAMVVSWVDADGALSLRRITPDYGLNATVQLTAPAAGRIKGFPRLALLQDYRGDKTSAQLLATFTREGSPSTVHTLLVDVPEGAFLEMGKDCDCAPTPEQLRGFPLRGTLVSVHADRGVVRVRHPEIPGMFAAGTHDFQVSPALLTSAVAPGRDFLGRFERTADGWRLFDLRLIASAKP